MEGLVIGILTAALLSTVGPLGTALFQLRGDVAKLAERLTALEVGQAEMRGEVAQVRGEIRWAAHGLETLKPAERLGVRAARHVCGAV